MDGLASKTQHSPNITDYTGICLRHYEKVHISSVKYVYGWFLGEYLNPGLQEHKSALLRSLLQRSAITRYFVGRLRFI
jgi:hypothetical protein